MLNMEGLDVFFYTEPVNMRCSIDGLSIIVAERLAREPGNGAWYVFLNRARDKLKILTWQCNGFCLWYKRLEKERFQVVASEDVLVLTCQQLRWLIDGLDYTKLQGHKALSYTSFY